MTAAHAFPADRLLKAPDADYFAQYLRRRAAEYFGNGDPILAAVRLTEARQRAKSTIYEFEVSLAGRSHFVVAKAPVADRPELLLGVDRATSICRGPRPRVFPKVNPADKGRLEYQALSSIRDYFQAIGDPRFGAIRTLDYLPQYGAILSEKLALPSLAKLLGRTNRFRQHLDWRELNRTFHNCGAWLRAFHAMPSGKDATAPAANRAGLIESVSTLTEFLSASLGDKRFFEKTRAHVTIAALDRLPEHLPCGTKHGDFAMRNILVGSNGSVTVLDTLAKWFFPVYADLAYFLTALKTTRPQVFSQGLAFSTSRLTQYERELLQGYFQDDPIPWPAIRLYEVFSLLDKWAGAIERIDTPSSSRRGSQGRFVDRFRLTLIHRFFRRSIQQRLSSL